MIFPSLIPSRTLYIFLSCLGFFISFLPIWNFSLLLHSVVHSSQSHYVDCLHTHTHTQFFSLSHTKACLSSTYRLTDQQVRPGPAASAEAAAVWMWGSAGMQHEKKAFNPSYIHTHSHISQWKVLKPPFLKLCKFWEPLGSRIFLLNKVHTHALTNFQSE